MIVVLIIALVVAAVVVVVVVVILPVLLLLLLAAICIFLLPRTHARTHSTVLTITTHSHNTINVNGADVSATNLQFL